MDADLNFANLFVQNDAGELLYFLVAVALSFASLLIAVDQRTRSKNEVTAGRYVVALLGVVLAWGSLTLGNLITLLNTDINAAQILPPLERAAITLVIIMLSWAFLTGESPTQERSTRLGVIMLLVFIGAAYFYTAISWSGETEFNRHQLGLAWTLIPMLIAGVGAGLLVTRFRYAADIPLKMLFFAIILVGHGYTLYQMVSDKLTGDAAGAVRLVMLGALALVPVLLYRVVIDRFRVAVGEMSDLVMTISQPVMSQATPPVLINAMPSPPPAPAAAAQQEAMSLLKILGIMLEKTAPDEIPLQISKAVARTFKADVVAIATTENPNWADTLAAYDQIRETSIGALTINLANQPSLVTAIQRNMQTVLLPGRNDAELVDLFYRLDSQSSSFAPAYIQPLPRDRKVVGVLIIAMPYSMRELDAEDRQLLQSLSPIAARLLVISQEALKAQNVADSQAIQGMVSGAPPSLPEMDTGRMIRTELQGQLEVAQQQINQLSQQIEGLQQQINRERTTLTALIKEGDSDITLTQKIRLLHEERERLAEERVQLVSALQAAQTIMATATADSDESVLRQLIDNLRTERDHLNEEVNRLHHELHQMRQTEDPSANLQAVMQTITADRDRLAAEQVRLSDEIKDTEAQLADLGLEGGTAGMGQLLAHLTEERNRYLHESRRAQAERDLLLQERQRIEAAINQSDARDQQVQALKDEIAHLASDREALIRQRDALKLERDFLNQQREEWIEARLELSQKYEEMRQKFHKANLAVSESWKKRTELEDALRDAAFDPDTQRRVKALEEDRSNMEYDLLAAREAIETLEQELIRYQHLATAPSATPEERDLVETIKEMAQELRTPLTSIIGYTDLLLGESTGILGAVQRQFLLRVKVNTERVLQMLEDLLRVMAIDMGTLALAPQKINMNDLIDDAITASSAQYREKGLTLHLDITDNLPAITADRDAIQQLVTQLLTNAYLAAPPDSIVRLGAHHLPEYRATNISNPENVIAVSVTDQGGGIPPDEQRRVFLRMYRAENTVIQGMGDKGVGLSVAHAIVTAHGGKIWFETEPGFSTTFKVVIPVEAVFSEKEHRRGSLTRLIGVLEEEE